MAHDHHHPGDEYFTDQLCMVGLSGAFGVICLCMYFIQSAMLKLLLAEQFHLFVMLSGFALLGLALVRAATLWRESKPKSSIASLPVVAADSHDHDHHHDHDHADHDHHHSHDHSHDDHDHGWAPWRYVVMLVPIMLFMLGLPNKGPKAADHNDAEGIAAEARREASRAAGLVGLDEWSRVAWFGKVVNDNSLGQAMPVEFKKVLDSPGDPIQTEFLRDKTIKLRGQFSPDPSDPRFFSLVRFSRQCCAGDAVAKRVNVFSREPILSFKRDEWVEVVGKVEYGKRGAVDVVRIATPGPANVSSVNPDPNFYID